MYCFFFFKQKTAYEMRISDWSSDVCSSDLHAQHLRIAIAMHALVADLAMHPGQRGAERRAHERLGKPVERPGVPHSDEIGLEGMHVDGHRSEERRVGKECLSTSSSWW